MSLAKLCSTKNVGQTERLLRIVLGFILVMFFFTGHLSGVVGILSLVFGLVLIATGVTACCAIYSLLGKSSCSTGK